MNKAHNKKTLENQHSTKGRYEKGSSKLNEEHKRFILTWLQEGKHKSSNEIWLHLGRIKKLKRVGYDSVNNFIRTLGSWVIPRMKTVISQNNLIKREKYCRENRYSIVNEDVLYTDESMFELNRNTARVFKFKREKMPEIERLSTWVRQMVWAGISTRGKTQVYFIDGWINHQSYVKLLKRARQEILSLFPQNFSFLQDNARPHVHKHSIQYIKRWISPHLKDHPPQSPDLNPIEIVWGRLKDLVEAKRPQNKKQLREAIIQSWDEIPLSYVKSCIQGLSSKMDQAIEDAMKKLAAYENVSEKSASSDGYDSVGDNYESREEDSRENSEASSEMSIEENNEEKSEMNTSVSSEISHEMTSEEEDEKGSEIFSEVSNEIDSQMSNDYSY